MVELAKTVFVTGPDDKVATKDVYTGQPNIPVNSVVPPTSQNSIAAALSQSIGLNSDTLLGTLSKLAKDAIGNVPSQVYALKQLTKIIGGSKSALANLEASTLTNLLGAAGLPTEQSDFITASVLGLPGGLSPKDIVNDAKGEFNVVVDGVSNIRHILDGETAGGIMGLISAIASTPDAAFIADALDLGAQFGALRQILDATMDYQIPELIDAIVGSLTEDKDKARLLIGSADAAALASDLYTLNLAIEYVGAQGLLARWPSIIHDLLANYKYPIDSTYPTQVDSDALVATLNALDPNWAGYNRGGHEIINLDVLTQANQQASATLALNATYATAVMLAPHYPSNDIIAIAKLQYPTAPLTVRASTNSTHFAT